jgi:hypothetical protein
MCRSIYFRMMKELDRMEVSQLCLWHDRVEAHKASADPGVEI